jgi:hypothetical protein
MGKCSRITAWALLEEFTDGPGFPRLSTAWAHGKTQCNACRHKTSLIAGTIFLGTKLGLTVWFLATYLISQATTGLSALALKGELGVSYQTAWLVRHKWMHAMAAGEKRYVLKGRFRSMMPSSAASVAGASHPRHLGMPMIFVMEEVQMAPRTRHRAAAAPPPHRSGRHDWLHRIAPGSRSV